METEVSIPELVPEKMLDAESKVISCEQLVETALEPISTELEKTPQEKADILKAEEPAENIMKDYKIYEDQIGNISGKKISNGITESIASENSGKVDGRNNPFSTAEDITMDAPSFEDNQQKGRPASEKLDNAAESVSDEQAGESLDADENAGKKHSDFASSDNLLEEGETKGMELAACREDRSMEKDHDAETMHIRPELKEDNIQEDRTKEEKIQMVAAKPNIKNDSMTFENVEESGDSGHKEKRCGPNDAIQGTEEETQHEENTMVIAMVTEEAGRQKTESEHEKLEQKVDIALQERSLEPDETSFRGENIEDTKTEESSMLVSEIPTASERYDTDKDSPAEKPAELPVIQALVREILQKGVTEEVKLKEEEKNAKEDITIENVAAEMIEQEKSKELPPPEAALEAKDNKKLDEKVECGNEMADARDKKETEIPAAAEIKETKFNTEDINLQKAELEHKKLEQDTAIVLAAKVHETKQTSIWAEEVGGMEIEKASSAVSEVPSVGKGEHTDMESTENKSGELPVIQTLVKEILQQDEIQEHKQENQDQSISEAKNPEEIDMKEDVTVDAREEQILHKVPLTEIPVEKAQDNENSNKKVDHCCYKITQENIETKIPGEADIVRENPRVPDASPTSQEFPSQNEDDEQANRVSETLSGESELSMANEGVNISETVEGMPAKASELQPEDQEVQRMAEVETRIGEDSVDDSSEKVFQEFSELKTDEKELESVNVSLKTDDLPVMHALVEESLQQGEIKGNKPEKAAQSVIEEKSVESITMTENAAANVPEEEKPPKVHPLETPATEDTGNLDGKEPMVEVPDKEDTQNSGNLQNQRSHSLETTDATGKTETEILVDREIHDRNFDVSTAEPVAEQTSSLEEQREEPNIIPETASNEQNLDASSSWSSEIEHEKVTIVSDGPTKGQETDRNTEAEASCSQTRIDDSSVQKLHKLSELKSEEEKKTSVPENERVDDQNPFENETQVENLDDVCLQKEAEYEKLGEAEPAKTEIPTVNKIHIAENESPSSVEALLEQTAEAAPSIVSEENPAKTYEETAATAEASLQVKERESDTLDKTKEMSLNAEMAEPCSKHDESDAEKLDITYDVTPKELEAAGESADTGKEVLGKEEIGPQEGRKEMKLLEHEAAGLQNVSDMTTNQTPNEEQNSRAIDPTSKTEAEEAKDEDNLHQNNDNLHTSSVEAEETMKKERSGTLDGISNVVPEKQKDTFDANNNVQFDSSREEDTVPDKLKESVSEDKSHNISTETGEDEAEEKICRAVALEEMKATDGTTSKSSDLTENIQNREEQYNQIEEPAGTVSDRLRTVGHIEETEREIPEEGMVIGSATARDKNVEKSFELNNEQKLPKQAIPEPEDEELSSNMNDNSETTIPHEVSEEPQAAGASENIEKKTEINANEDRNALSASSKTPNETIGEDEKKHQEATSQLYDEEQHCKANDHSDSTKEGHNEEDKDSHVVPEERDFSTVVSNNNVETIPLRIADDPNEINDASSVKTASTDEPLVTEPDRIEATSGGTDSQKKTVEEDTILKCASITPAQDELLAESQWTKLEGATHDYQSEDQSFKANHTFKVLDEEVCEAAGAHESVEGQTTKGDGAFRDLDASVTNVALEENFEDEQKKLEGTPHTTVENQSYEVNNATDPINSNQNKEVKGSILVSKEQEFQTTDLAEEIETVSSVGEQNPEDIADALGVETTSTENMLNALSKGLSTASGDQETQGIDKQIIHEEFTGKGVDDTFIQDEPAPKTQLEKVKSKQEVEDQSSQADNKDKIPNREGCQIADATQEDGSTKDLDASSTMDAPVDDNFPEDKKLEEGKTQAKDHIYKSNDTFDLTKTSKNEEVQVSEVVPGDREFEETGSTEMIGTMVSMGDNKLNEMTDLSPVAITSTQLDRASEEPETSSKCEDIQKQMIENVDLIGGDHEVSIKDKTAHESEESQKPKEAVPEVEAQRHHTKEELVHESDESQKLKETIPEVVAQRNQKEYELVHVGRESQKPEEAVLEVETQRRHSEDKPVHESEDSQKLEEVVPEVETQRQHTEDQKVHESEESQKPDEAVLEVEAQRYHMEDEPIHESEESQRPEEVVPEVETERHHKEDEPVYQSKESQRPEEVIPDGEAQIHHEEDELLHESEDSQKPKEAVPEVEAHRHHMEDDIVHKSEDSQKLKEADPEVGAQRHHMEHEPDHESREKQRPEEAVPEIETQRHRTEDAPICESQENQKSEEVVPEVGTQICHTEDEKVHESEENQKPKEVVTEVEAQRHHMENELFHETEESERPEEAVLEVETQRLHMADEPAHGSKESQRLEEAVPEVEAQRHYIKDELVHESEENQKPKEAIPKVEAQKHHTEHEPVHEEEESQKPEVVLEIETQRHNAKDELMHENKESRRPEEAIAEVETQIHHTEDEIVHESEESQKSEEVVLEVQAQRHHTEDEPDHKSEESQETEEVVPDIKAQSHHTVDVSGGQDTNVENKDTEMRVVEDVAIKDLNASTAKDASIEENFHEDLKEQEKLEKANDTTQNRGNKEEYGGYETIVENKDTETHVVEEEVAMKNLSPSTKDTSIEEKFNENLKEQEKEKLEEARPVLEVEDKAFEGNDTTRYGQSIEVNSAELATKEQELETRASIEKLETNTTILDKDTKQIIDTSLAEATSVENLLYASSEATVTTGGNEEIEKQMIEEECTVKSASILEKLLQEREPKELNGETPKLEAYHSYKIDDTPEITDLNIKVSKGLEAASKFENVEKQTIEEDRHVKDIDSPSDQYKAADNFLQKQKEQKRPNEATCHSDGERHQSEVNDTSHTNDNGQSEEARASNLQPIEKDIKTTASTEKKNDVALESNNNLNQVVNTSTAETSATEESAQEEGEKHLEATSFVSNEREIKDSIQVITPKEDCTDEKIEATEELVSEEEVPTKIEVPLPDVKPCKTVDAFHDSSALIQEFMEKEGPHVEVDKHIKEATDVSESTKSFVLKEEKNTNATEIEQLEKAPELGSEVITEQTIILDKRENEMGKKDEILHAEMVRNGTVSEELQNPSQTPMEWLETAVMSVSTETQIIEKKEGSTNHDTAYFEVEEAKQTVSENENKSMEVEEATAEYEPEGLHHETKEVNVNTVKGVSIKETYSEVEETGSSKDVEQNVKEVEDAKEEKVEVATADFEPVGPNCETKESNYITVKGDSIEEASLEVQVGGSSKHLEQKVEEEKVEEAEETTANFEADGQSCQTKEAHDYTVKGLSIKEASSEVEVGESSKDIEQKAEEGKEADKGEAKEPTAELKAEGPSHQTMEENNSTEKDVSIKKASLEVEAASSSKSSEENEQKVKEKEEGKKENDGDATAELEPEGPSCGTKEVNIPVEGVPINFMASSELAAAGTSNDIEQKTEEEKEAKKEKAEEATAELEPEGPSCEAKEANDTTVTGASAKEVSSELEVDGSSKDREQEEEEEKVKEAKAELKQSGEMKQSNDITTKGSSVDETYSEIEEAGSSKDVEQNIEEVKDAKEEKVKAATADLEPVGPNCETKETIHITVKGDSIEEASLEVQVGGSSKDLEQKVEEEKVEEAEETTANFEADRQSYQTKEAHDYTVKGLSIKEASSEVEVDESSKDIEQKAEEADKGEAKEPTAELKAEGPSHQTMEENNSTEKDVSIKKASLEVEAASSSKSSEDNEQKVKEEEEGKKENDGDATAELEPEGPSCGTKEVNIPVEGVPINFMASSELAAAGTSNDIEQKTEEEKEAKKEKAEEATAELEPEGPSCEAKEANDTTVKGASIEEVSSELEVDGSSKDREQEEEEEKVNEATAELKTKGQSCEMNHENEITIKGFSIDKVSSELEGDGSSKDIVEEEKEAKEEKVEEATAELKPTSPSYEAKEVNDITVEESSIKEVSSEFEVDGSTKDIEQKVEEEKEANELNTVSVGEVVPSFETKYAEDTTKNAMPNEKVKDFNSALTEQRLQTLETTVTDDKNDLDTSTVGREVTNGILNRISDISAAIGSSSSEILQKENATDATCSEPEEQNHAKVDGKEATVPATEQAAAEEIFLKEVERKQLKEVMNDETNENETSKHEGHQHTGLDSSPVPNASATKVLENEGTKPDKTSNLLSEKIQETIGVNDIKGIHIPMPEEARDFSSTEKEKDQKRATEDERETSKVVLKEQGPEEIHPEETTESANEEISERNIYGMSVAQKSEGQDMEVPDLGIEASSQEMVAAIDCKDPSLAESETTTLESKGGIGNFVVFHNSASNEKIHDAVLENKEVESSTLRTDESPKKSFDDQLFPQTSGEEISQKEDSKKNAGSTEILQASSSDPQSDLGEPIERTTLKAVTEDLKLSESSQVEPDLKRDKVEEERQDGTVEKRMETTTEDLIEEQNESDAGKVRLFDLLERSKREKIKSPEGLVHEGHQAGKEDEVQNIQAATGQVEEEKTEEEEDDDHKKDESGSDAPVIVEAARDVDLKPTHKKSHNILSGVGSKVKHSIAKVKKAITGKSTHSKSQSPK